MERLWKRWGNIIFLGGVFTAYLALTLFLFHRQSVSYGGRYTSDMSSYIGEIEGISSGYDFPYPVMFWIAQFFSLFTTTNHAMAMTVTGLNGLNFLVLKYYFDKFLLVDKGDVKGGCASTVMVFLVLFASMLFPLNYLGKYYPLGEAFLYRYKGIFSPNPFHNATYLAARPFAVIAFFLAIDILQDYESNERWFRSKYVSFAIVLLVATMTKPSFTLVLVCVCGFIMLWRLLRSKLKGMKAFWQFGITFIPTLLDLLYQYRGVFTEAAGEEKGIGVGFLVAWKTATDNIVASIFLAIAFPLAVLLFQRTWLRENRNLLFSWQFYLAGLLMLLFLYEKGYRLAHINFAWGYMYGLFFLYITSLIVLIQETRMRRQAGWELGLQWVVFTAHMICGVDYFRIVMNGYLYL